MFLMPTLMSAQRLTQHVRVGVVLPLKEKSARGAKMLEFYQGLLMAVDSVKHLGCSVDVTAVHSGALAADMDSLLATPTLSDCDVIFGPLDVTQLPALTDYCDLRGIRLVVPFSTLATHVADHPLHYLVNAPRHVVQRQATWFVETLFSEDNVIVVECGEKNDEGEAFVERVRMALDGRNVFVRQIALNATDEAFAQVLAEGSKNVLLPNASSLTALTALTARLRQLTASFPNLHFTLLGYPAWQSYATQMQSDFSQFDTYIYTPFFRDHNEPQVIAFDERFQTNFHHAMQPTFPRYGLFGFDLAYYFLYGLGMYGHLFEDNLSAIPVAAMQNRLDFEKQGETSGYINTFVQVVHYTTAHTTELLFRHQQ